MSDARSTFAEVYRTERDRLLRIALAMCGDQRAAEDAVAEAVLRVWPHFRAGRVQDAGAYLRRAVSNEVVTRHRRRYAERAAHDRRGPEPMAAEAPDFADRFIWEVVRRLPFEQRAVLVLRFVADLSERETAAALHIRVGTVKSRASRAMQTLRDQLEGVGING